MTPPPFDLSDLFYASFSVVKPRSAKGDRSTDDWSSHVFPHSPIQPLAPGLWHVTGFLPPAPREMILYRLPDGGLLIHSAIALDEPTMAALEALGTPTIMIVPNRIHRLDAAVFKQRYPQMQVVAPRAAQPYVEEVVPVDAIAEDLLPQYGIICHDPQGIRPQELVYELPLETGTALVFTDILFNLTDAYLDEYMPRTKFVLHWLGAAGYFGITALGKRFFMTDRATYRQWLLDLADTVSPICAISVAHGAPITVDCRDRLREAAARLS
jgi:hypothetical protein